MTQMTKQMLNAEIDCLNDEEIAQLKGEKLRAIYKHMGGTPSGNRSRMRAFIQANYITFNTEEN